MDSPAGVQAEKRASFTHSFDFLLQKNELSFHKFLFITRVNLKKVTFMILHAYG